MEPVISIVTGTRNRPESLSRLLESISETASVDTEIIVADASDELLGMILVNYGNIVRVDHFHESPRLGPNLGYNVAFRRATGKYVCFVNDDCEMIPGWDRTAIDFMDANPQVGLGALYFSVDGCQGQFYVQTYQHLIVANLGIYRRSVGDEVGWFEERKVFIPEFSKEMGIEFYGNDTAASLKVIDAGYAVCPIPGCRIIHHREQDAERAANNASHVYSEHGNIAGRVIWWLYNDPVNSNGQGHEYGYQRLRQKMARFPHLPKDIYCNLPKE